MAGVVDVAVGNSLVDVSAVSRHVRSITLRSDLQRYIKGLKLRAGGQNNFLGGVHADQKSTLVDVSAQGRASGMDWTLTLIF